MFVLDARKFASSTQFIMRLLVCDCETTGLLESTLIELAAQTYCTETNTVLASIQFLLPTDVANPAESINHISTRALRQHTIPSLQTTFSDMFSDATCILAHNAQFDRHFIERHFPGLPAKPWICTIKDIPFRQGGSQKLTHVAVDFGVPVNNAHRALGDVETLVGLLAQVRDIDQKIEHVLSLREHGKWYKLSTPNDMTPDQKKKIGFTYNTKARVWCQCMLPGEVKDFNGPPLLPLE